MKNTFAIFALCLAALVCYALPEGALTIVDANNSIPSLELFQGATGENGILHFTGETGCRAEAVLPSEYNGAPEFSYAFWFRLMDNPGYDLNGAGKRDCAVPLSRNWNWNTRIRPSMEIYEMMLNSPHGESYLGRGARQAKLCEWTHVAITYSVTQKALRFYINGEVVAENAGSAFKELRPETAKLNIGSDSECYNAFPGDVANIYLFPRAISEDELAELYATTPAAQDHSLQKLWQEVQDAFQSIDISGYSEDAKAKYAELSAEINAYAEVKGADAHQKLQELLLECQKLSEEYPKAVETVRRWADDMKDEYSILALRVKAMAKNAPVAIADFQKKVSAEVEAWQKDAAVSENALCYLVSPTSATPILPDTEIPAERLGNALTCTLTPGEYEGVSFVLKPFHTLKNVRFIMPTLADDKGNIIPAENLDFKYVLCWYQAGSAWQDVSPAPNERKLVPELMVNDPEIIKVDFDNQTDYVKLQTPHGPRYACATHPEKLDPRSRWNFDITNEEYPVKDAPKPLPTTLQQDENRQFIITVHAPEDALPGTYTGNIRIVSDFGEVCPLNISVTVLPFTLAEPKTNYDLSKEYYISLYQVSTMDSNSKGVISPFARTPDQYKAELENLSRHGISNPLFYQYQTSLDREPSIEDFKTALQMRLDAGLKCRPLFLSGPESNMQIGTDTSPAKMAKFHKTAKALLDAVEEVTGHRDVYFYGIDEAYNEVLRKERPIWEEFHNMGAKVLVSSCDTQSVFNEVGDLLDLLVHCRKPSAKEAELWHSKGKLIFSYGNPQGGVENPDAYRRNYGLLLYQKNYDGTCTYSNYEAFGNPWDDFDSKDYRDHNLVYPTTDGVIDTIAYEGLREAADDVKYATTLRLAAKQARENGNAALADETEAFLRDLDTEHADLDQARATIIDYILKLQ